MTILVTGFEPNDDGLNASKILVESLRDDPPESLSGFRDLIHYAVIPANTNQIKAVILEHISRYNCIMLTQRKET